MKLFIIEIIYREGFFVKVLIINKRKLITVALILCLVIALIIGSVAFVPQVSETIASNRLIPIYNVDRQDKYISISFDAAWGNVIIEIL